MEAGRSSSEGIHRRSSELLVEWSSPLSLAESEQDQKDNGGDQNTSSTERTSSTGRTASSGGTTGHTSFASNLSNISEAHQTQRASVHFSPMAYFRVTPSLKAYSPERIEKIYYTKADLAEQRAEYVATAKEMNRRHRRGEDPLQVHEVKLKTTRLEHDHQPSIITTATTTRGLEHMVSRRTIERHQQEQCAVIGVVLLAQENDFTSEEIALLYSHQARSAKARARSLGLVDAQL